jgi:hypothetical protein
MHFLQFGRNPVNTLVRIADIKSVMRSVNLREIILRTYQNDVISERYQEHEVTQFDARWVSLRNLMVNA